MIEQGVVESAGQCLIKGSKEEAVSLARQVIDGGADPVELMNLAFIPAINEVGDRFGRGQLFLPELITAADAMKAVTDVVNEVLSATTTVRSNKGTILIATVKGDVHDIGKCIVTSLLQANGFRVHDIGRDIDTEKIVEQAVQHDVDIIGTSALLTTTMPRQKELEELLKAKGLREKFKTMVGGAPVTPRWAQRIGADAYAEDAQDGVRKAEQLLAIAVS
ncbi:cobalamin B12-binding domain-containing protein [Desulforhopalus singaporensis]|uniref:Trimethylamine corrinoid protein n=1 Tax=Desulforhopalus singaporensis TaxID=91360 RepID=A0A1H0IYM5_9BACT|nr:corrinoid protein [Desulforhopalus singaporensis]SDO36432.1 trimethylamine corrinoid protein [Desulforhopalus singaporensis]